MSDDTANLPEFQKAWRVVRMGKPSKALEFSSNVPVPKDLKQGEVLVKIHAAALNPIGYKLMSFAPNFIMNRPHVAEHDLSGVVVKENGTEFKDGDEVMGWIFVGVQRQTSQGALAEYAIVPASALARKSSNISYREAAGLSLTAMTAYGALVEAGRLLGDDKKNDDNQASSKSVFINGGSTAVGQMAIMIAKALGAKKVAASCSSRNIDLIKELGADEVYDYTKRSLSAQLSTASDSPKYDIFFDAYGEPSPSLYTSSDKYITPNGIYITVGVTPSSVSEFLKFAYTIVQGTLLPTWLGGVQAGYKLFGVRNEKTWLDALAKLVEDGKLKPRVDSHFKFEDTLKAYEKLMTGKAVGKVVVDVVESD